MRAAGMARLRAPLGAAPPPRPAPPRGVLPPAAPLRRLVRRVAARASSSSPDAGPHAPAPPLHDPARPRGAVMWFRQDLRLHDNRAFRAAVKAANRGGGDLVCVFVWSDDDAPRDAILPRSSAAPPLSPPLGEASRVWLRHALDALDRDVRLKYGGGGVSFLRGDRVDALRVALRAANATRVFATERHEPAHVAQDREVRAELARYNTINDASRERPEGDPEGFEPGSPASYSLDLLPGHLLFDPGSLRLDMANERYFFGTLMPFLHAAEKFGGDPGAPVPAPPEARVRDIVDARSGSVEASGQASGLATGSFASGPVAVAADAGALGVSPASLDAVDWAAGLRASWDVSERGAEEVWEAFAGDGGRLARYEADHGRADAGAEAVSRLSPYLRFGQISPRRVYKALSSSALGGGGGRKSGGKKKNAGAKGGGGGLSRLFWHRLYRREFAYWQQANWPEMHRASVRQHYEARRDWIAIDDDRLLGGTAAEDTAYADATSDSADSAPRTPLPLPPLTVSGAEALRRWQRGETGFPVVDAGMRRLWRTGWMHQTERMLAATFLTDYLGVHWRHGHAWFHDCLVDADLAINSMMWQNAGKSGLDQWDVFAAGLVPDGTCRAHDPKGDAIAEFVPELAGLHPGHLRARPWDASAAQREKAGVVLGVTYPERIVVVEPADGRETKPFAEEARRRMLAGVGAARAAHVLRAAEAAEKGAAADEASEASDSSDSSSGVNASETGVSTTPACLVDAKTGADYVVVPPGATRAHAGMLLPLSTRKEFKRALKSALPRATLDRAAAWASAALRVGTTAAGRSDPSSDETGFARACEVGRKRSERARRDGTEHSHSHSSGGHAHSHSHGGHSHAPGDAVARGHLGHTHQGAGAGAKGGGAKAEAGGGSRGRRPEKKKPRGSREGFSGGADVGRSASRDSKSRGTNVNKRSSSWARGSDAGSGGAARRGAARDAERQRVKAGRREARALAAAVAGMRVGDVDAEEGEEEEGWE